MRLVCLAIFPLVLTLSAPGLSADSPPKPRIPVGRDNTYLDGPLDANGNVDYETALLARARGKITPDRNAQVLLLQAMGPAPCGGDGLSAKYFAALGIPPLPKQGEYFLQVGQVRGEKEWRDVQWRTRVMQERDHSADVPWKRADHPDLAAWLDSNEKPLALVLEAARRPEHFNPLVTDGPQNPAMDLYSVPLLHVQTTRELCRALSCRAMLRLGEGSPGEAWDDLIAMHRLARLVSRGSTYLESCMGIAIERAIARTDIAFLQHCRFSSRQFQRCVRDLGDLPPHVSLADKFDLGERVMCLDTLQRLRNGHAEGLQSRFRVQTPLDEGQKKALANLDWASIHRSANAWYDKLAAAYRLPDYTSRRKGRTALFKSYAELKSGEPEFPSLPQLLFENPAGDVTSPRVGNRLMSLLLNSPASSTILSPPDRSPQFVRNLQIGFALSAFRRDHRGYPDKLEELIPTYLPSIEPDVFTNQPLIYRATADEFHLYSVGDNGRDDGGKPSDKGPFIDDLAIRIQSKPLPPLK